MNRRELEEYIQEKYSAEPDYPWLRYPGYEVFRHKGCRKWFALFMDVPKDKLGLDEDGILDVVNFKCGLAVSGAYLHKEGFFPAYHMNKASWITVALDGSAPDDDIKWLLDLSYESTSAEKHRKRTE